MSKSSKSFEINLDEYNKLSKIGAGAFGEVFQIEKKENGDIYAAKISTIEFDEQNSDQKKNLIREVEIISKIDHPSIVKFIGFSETNFEKEKKPVIVTEFVENGSLKDMIEAERKKKTNSHWNDTYKLINLYGIASAMSFLHFRDILHRDLKPDNILLDKYLFPKIADFGLSKDESIESSTKEIKGTPSYLAPEIIEDNDYSKASDVYAFGILAYEVITGKPPFDKKSSFYKVINDIVKGKRPIIGKVPSDSYRQLIERCWDKEPSSRPTFDEIRNNLKEDKGFITAKVNEKGFQFYVRKIDKSLTKFDEKNYFHFPMVQLNKNKILPEEEYEELNKKCQKLVDEATKNPDLQFEVGKNFVEGINKFPKNVDNGILYLKSSIEGLNVDAAIYYNRMLIKGKEIPQDLQQAKSNLKKFLYTKNKDVIVLIGIIDRKNGYCQEAIDAFYDNRKNNAEANYQLGKMLYLGEDVEEDREAAESYFNKAKSLGCDKVDKFLEKNKKAKIHKSKRKIHKSKRKIDIAFLIDGNVNTWPIYHSFCNIIQGTIEKVQNKFPKIMFRFGAVIYKSKPIADRMLKPTRNDDLKYYDFTDNIDEIEAFITKNKPRSINKPTDWASGYECLANNMKWGKNAEKAVIHICNAPGLGKSFTMDDEKSKKFIKIPIIGKNYSESEKIFDEIQKREDKRFKKAIEQVAAKEIKFYCLNFSIFSLQCFKNVSDYFRSKNGKKFIIYDALNYHKETKVDRNNIIMKELKKIIFESIRTHAETREDDYEDNIFEKECLDKFEKDLKNFNHPRKSPKHPRKSPKQDTDDTDDDDDNSDIFNKTMKPGAYKKSKNLSDK